MRRDAGAGLRSALASQGWVCRGRERVFAGSNIDGCTLLRVNRLRKRQPNFFWPPSPRLFGEKLRLKTAPVLHLWHTFGSV